MEQDLRIEVFYHDSVERLSRDKRNIVKEIVSVVDKQRVLNIYEVMEVASLIYRLSQMVKKWWGPPLYPHFQPPCLENL